MIFNWNKKQGNQVFEQKNLIKKVFEQKKDNQVDKSSHAKWTKGCHASNFREQNRSNSMNMIYTPLWLYVMAEK